VHFKPRVVAWVGELLLEDAFPAGILAALGAVSATAPPPPVHRRVVERRQRFGLFHMRQGRPTVWLHLGEHVTDELRVGKFHIESCQI
jgi:hypothetical protein